MFTIQSGGYFEEDIYADEIDLLSYTTDSQGITVITSTIISGGTDTDTQVFDGGTQNVRAGGTAINTTVSGGAIFGGTQGNQNVSAGGTAIDTQVLNFGTQNVWADGTAIDTQLLNYGTQNVWAGGTAIDTLVGAVQAVYSGGTASDTTVKSGGFEYVYSGGTTSDTTVDGGGSATIQSGGAIEGVTVISGGTLELEDGATASGSIDYSGSGGTLQIDGTTMPTNVISGFAPGDTIDLAGVTVGSLEWLQSTNQSNQTLGIVSTQGQTYDLTFSGAYDGQTIMAEPDDDGGTDLLLAPSAQDLAQMSADTYTIGPAYTVDGFSLLETVTGLYGFAADVFTNGMEDVVAFRGTQLTAGFTSAFKTLLADSSWVTGTIDSNLFGEVSLGAQLINSLDQGSDEPIILTGHSLGGAIAQILGTETGLPVMGFDAPQSGRLFSQFLNDPGLGDAFSRIENDSFQDYGTDDNIRMYGDQVSVTGTPLSNADMWTITPASWKSTVDSQPVELTFLDSHDIGFMTASLDANDPITPGIAGPVGIEPLVAGTPIGIAIGQALGALFSNTPVGKFLVTVQMVNAAIDPSAATAYALVADAGSPLIASVTLPDRTRYRLMMQRAPCLWISCRLAPPYTTAGCSPLERRLP
jgi:autotransporter passenger strand-loop-strand repeat protein